MALGTPYILGPPVHEHHHVGHRDTQEPSRGHTASKQLS